MPPTGWFFVALAAVPWVQWLFGLFYYSGDAWSSSLYMLGIAMAISTGYGWAQTDAKRLAALLSVAILVAAVISSGIALDQALGGYPMGIWADHLTHGFRAIGNVAQSNNLATLIAFGVIGLLLLREQRVLGNISSVCIAILLVSGAAATQSRTSLLYGPMLVCGLYYFSKYKSVAFVTKPLTLGIVTTIYTGLIFWFHFLLQIVWQMSANSFADRGLETARVNVWPILIDGLNHKPWFGYGWLQVASAQYEVANLHPPVKELFAQAHNLFLDLLISCGYPLGILLCFAVIYWFITRMRKVATVEAVFGMLLLGILGIHSMLELPYYYSYFLIPVGLWVGLIECSVDSMCWLSFRWKWFVCALTSSIFIAVCWDYPKVEEDFRTARFAYLNVNARHDSGSEVKAPFLSNLVAYLQFYRTTPKPGMSNEALAALEAVTRRYPYGRLLFGYAEALAFNDQLSEATKVFLKIRFIFGDSAYFSYREALHKKATNGTPMLVDLDQSLPY